MEVRELLKGELADGAPEWPEQLRPMLHTRGFAEELRDFLMRAQERGLGADDIRELGRRHARADWIAAGGFLMTCSVGPVAAIAIDVAHPGLRATACSVLSLAQNLFGLALGPVIAGALSDAFGIERALSVTPAFGLLAAVAFLSAARSYEADRTRAKFHVPALASRASAAV